MRFDIVTIFPNALDSYFATSILKRGQEKGLITINTVNIRDFADDKHHTTDEPPYGGGPGMVMKPGPIFSAVESIAGTHESSKKAQPRKHGARVILLTPRGKRFTQKEAQRLAHDYSHLIFVCGRYEGIDERVHEHLADEELSIGDYVLSGGELAAAVVTEAVARLIPGVIGKEESLLEETFTGGGAEYPQYTRPEDFRGWKVPEVLLSGHHGKVKEWRNKKRKKQ